MSVKKTVEFDYTLPGLAPYEGKATSKQKKFIWDLGFKDQAVIDKLGKDQASYLIDRLQQVHKENQPVASPVSVFVFVLLIIGGAAYFFFQK